MTVHHLHGHGGVRGRPNRTVRSTLIRSILNPPSAPLSWFSLGSTRTGQYQVNQGVGVGKTPEKGLPANRASLAIFWKVAR